MKKAPGRVLFRLVETAMLSIRADSALSRASTLGQNGILAYNGLNVPDVYAEEFTKYYDAGLSGMSIRSADKVTGSVMPEYMKSLAHEAGRLDARAYANKNTPDDSEAENAKHVLKELKISVGMSEAERYEVLKNKEIPLKTYNDSKLERYKYIDGQEINVDSLINMKKTDAKKILRLLGEKFEIFKEYYNEDVNLSFEYSKTGL